MQTTTNSTRRTTTVYATREHCPLIEYGKTNAALLQLAHTLEAHGCDGAESARHASWGNYPAHLAVGVARARLHTLRKELAEAGDSASLVYVAHHGRVIADVAASLAACLYLVCPKCQRADLCHGETVCQGCARR